VFLSFLGCDGSGKSAVIAGVTERLEKQGVVVTRGHWRPQALDGERTAAGGHGHLGERTAARGYCHMGERTAAGGYGHVAADDPHGQVARGMATSVLKLGWLWLNWWVGWWRFLRKQSAEGVVLFDRYHADLLVDPRRYRYGGPLWLARLASRLMPQPDLVIFLDAETEVLLARKQEVSREALEQARERYLELTKSHPRFLVVDASQPLEKVIGHVLEMVEKVGRIRPGPPP
jgi:thymidylate kinase